MRSIITVYILVRAQVIYLSIYSYFNSSKASKVTAFLLMKNAWFDEEQGIIIIDIHV